MQNLWKRFALLAIVGSLLSSAMLAGCGGSGDEDTPANNTAPKAKDEE